MSKRMGAAFAAAALVVFALHAQSLACTCPPSTFCEKTSSSVWLIHGRVTEKIDPKTQVDPVVVTVEIQAILKSNPAVRIGNVITVKTGANSALCGVLFTVGEEYLFAMNDDFYVSSCGATRQWSTITKEQFSILSAGGDCPVPAKHVLRKDEQLRVADSGRVTEKIDPKTQVDPVVVTVEIQTIFKSNPAVRIGSVITVTTGANSALCGVLFTVGEEYLFAMNDDFYVSSCGATQQWSTLTKEQFSILSAGGDCPVVDPCS
eukprot:CAMPEP_0185856456 /NCGR_PEP_ID=MMETSP1354-20130828/29006_1 /TAXON_ID=708628 /ORGANISM="Erythrolobus madagascarensis, Strain CCMP3276" /LENGTH=261 /DNA_ID=CAMNT_0028558707 /DNA_START=59 /DNA_END=842 /DNA_ORIENTATION=-